MNRCNNKDKHIIIWIEMDDDDNNYNDDSQSKYAKYKYVICVQCTG